MALLQIKSSYEGFGQVVALKVVPPPLRTSGHLDRTIRRPLDKPVPHSRVKPARQAWPNLFPMKRLNQTALRSRPWSRPTSSRDIVPSTQKATVTPRRKENSSRTSSSPSKDTKSSRTFDIWSYLRTAVEDKV
ncbi:hypothetical protein EC957_007723 [Mortierella hygrophila]|uniref:Uncharacterized protein n=1 Tax=Mortierella hygrophila TaxID=979708 RepID=A0A9P6JYE7_9FUNG|nr:hypothetical protein EC957_007723 [Mortierella hygrophila]